LDITNEVAVMERMTINELRAKFAEAFGEPTNGRHKQWLIKRIAWRLQANAEGDLSERALRRAMELANDAELRVTAPREPKLAPNAEQRTITVSAKIQPSVALFPTMVLRREYQGRMILVTVLKEGFEFEGERYKSLTAITKVITGKHWNGHHFFGLRANGGER
jgi:hypothetical protein